MENLGVVFDEDMSSNADIKQICRNALLHPCIISKIGNILLQGDIQKLVHAFITSNLTMEIHYYYYLVIIFTPHMYIYHFSIFVFSVSSCRCLCSLFHVSSLPPPSNQSWQTSLILTLPVKCKFFFLPIVAQCQLIRSSSIVVFFSRMV